MTVTTATVLLALTGAAGSLALLALVGLALVGRQYLDLQLDIAGMTRRGADAETAVGRVVDSLVPEGYLALHDLEALMPGNVDHVVCGPTGAFVIETKSRAFTAADLKRTKDAARRVARQTGRTFVVPVICLHLRPDVQWRQDKVDIVGIDRLADFIRSRRHPPCDPDDFMGLAGRG